MVKECDFNPEPGDYGYMPFELIGCRYDCFPHLYAPVLLHNILDIKFRVKRNRGALTYAGV